MDDSRDMPLQLDGSCRSLSWPFGMGIMWPCRKGAGMCPVASMALKALVKCKMSEGPPRCPVRLVCLVLEQKRLQNLIAACNFLCFIN